MENNIEHADTRMHNWMCNVNSDDLHLLCVYLDTHTCGGIGMDRNRHDRWTEIGMDDAWKKEWTDRNRHGNWGRKSKVGWIEMDKRT